MIAKEYGQDPRIVATWEQDWISAAVTVINAAAAAKQERQVLDERRARARGGR